MIERVKTRWHIVGEEAATCNCAWGCPCQFNALPTHGRCEALVGVRIREGQYGRTKLDGLGFAEAFWFPGAVHEGKGIARAAIDERTTPEQRTALLNILTAKDGGMPWEIFASVTETFLDPLFVPIRFETDREKRIATLKAPGLGEFRTEPIKNPVTGEEYRALIRLPNGFEYKEAEMGNAVLMHGTLGDKTLTHQNTYAQLAAVEWSNS
ncbi:MAG: hypothetical protein DMG32_21735 [Acidobacteria bacterium]|nr:MAG: hypothetical protein DMG32_21735 [Acidobacteriota bacterium]